MPLTTYQEEHPWSSSASDLPAAGQEWLCVVVLSQAVAGIFALVSSWPGS